MLRRTRNIEKSTVTLVQCIEFIGAVLDSTRARAFLLEACFQAMSDLIAHMRHPITVALT